MKNKKVLITIISIFIVIICLIVFFVIKNNIKATDSSNNENYLSIQSTKEHKITKNGIEAENIELIKEPGRIKVVTTIKNYTDSTINNFFLEVKLLDANGNEVTSIAKNSNEKIPANQTIQITNYVSGVSNMQNITSAKIGLLEIR